MKTKRTKLKKVFSLVLTMSLFFSLTPVLAEENQTAEVIEPNQMIHYAMTIQWGNVRGDATSNEKTNFDGFVAIASTTSAISLGRISLIKELLFEKDDQILIKTPYVSWQSWIYNHWEGVRVMVSAKADANITVKADGGEITKTAKEFFQAKKPIIVEVANGREIIIKTQPLKRPKMNLIAQWGRTDASKENKNIVDFSGSFKLNQGGAIKLGKKIRFEKGDEITGLSKTNIDWRSTILNDKDGILIRFALDKTLTPSSTITVYFKGGVNWSKDFNLIDLYHQKIVEEQITVNGDANYGLTLALDKKPNRSLIKAKNSSRIYMIEDEVKKPVPSEEVLEENGLSMASVETVEEDELDSYPEGEALNYPDGTLIQGSKPAVYVIADGKKRLIKNAKALVKLGYKKENIKKVKDAELGKYENGVAIDENSSHPEGSLVKVKGTAGVYQVKGGKLNSIISREVFEANKLKWNKVLEITKEQKEKFSQGSELNYPDGTLLKGDGAGVYIIDKGVKRAFKSTDDLNSLGYKAKQIIKIQEKLLNKFSKGKDMIGK